MITQQVFVTIPKELDTTTEYGPTLLYWSGANVSVLFVALVSCAPLKYHR